MAEVRGDIVYKSPNMTIRFDLNRSGIVHYAMTSSHLGTALENLVSATKRYAELISPYDRDRDRRTPGDLKGPHYKDSWRTTPYIERHAGDPPFPRQAQLLQNTSPHARIVEFGNGKGDHPYGHRVFADLFDFLEHYIP